MANTDLLKKEFQRVLQGFTVHVYRTRELETIGQIGFDKEPIPDDYPDGDDTFYHVRIARNGISVEDALRFTQVNDSTILGSAEFLVRWWAGLRFIEGRGNPALQPVTDQKDMMIVRRSDVEDIVGLLLEWEQQTLKATGDADGLFASIINQLRGLEIKPAQDAILVKPKGDLK